MKTVDLVSISPLSPQLIDLSPFAYTLYVGSLAYCQVFGTGGFFPHGALRRIIDFEYYEREDVVASGAVVGELVGASLWEETEGGWDVPMFRDAQDTTEV